MHQNKFDTLTIDAGADLSAHQHKVIVIAGTIAASHATAVGLLQNKPGATGRHATIGYAGQMKAYAGAAVTTGVRLSVTTSGYVIDATSANIAAGAVVGRSLAAANSGDLFPGIFNFAK